MENKGKIILIVMDLKEIGINTRSWFDSAQDTDYWRAHVNATLNIPQTIEIECNYFPDYLISPSVPHLI